MAQLVEQRTRKRRSPGFESGRWAPLNACRSVVFRLTFFIVFCRFLVCANKAKRKKFQHTRLYELLLILAVFVYLLYYLVAKLFN